MIAQGFKPVGWVAGVAAAALTCYMLSLNVAAERAELKKLEWRIIMAKKEIRTLQTELGTRGRLTQLENWNANVLALSAPTADQFVDSEVTLARFDRTEDTLGEQAPVRMASADAEKPVATPRSEDRRSAASRRGARARAPVAGAPRLRRAAATQSDGGDHQSRAEDQGQGSAQGGGCGRAEEGICRGQAGPCSRKEECGPDRRQPR
jgi:hypothetical protein